MRRSSRPWVRPWNRKCTANKPGRRPRTGVRASPRPRLGSMSSVASHRVVAEPKTDSPDCSKQRADRRGREHPTGLGVIGDRLEPGPGALEPRGLRRRRRDADQAGIKAAEEPDEEFEAGRIDQERSLARRGGLLEPAGHRSCAARPAQLYVIRSVSAAPSSRNTNASWSPWPAARSRSRSTSVSMLLTPRSSRDPVSGRSARLRRCVHSFTTIAAPNVNPPPNADIPILRATVPRSASSHKQMGMLEDDVLPWIFKLLKTFSSGKLSRVLRPLIIVWLPWWGTIRSSSSRPDAGFGARADERLDHAGHRLAQGRLSIHHHPPLAL